MSDTREQVMPSASRQPETDPFFTPSAQGSPGARLRFALIGGTTRGGLRFLFADRKPTSLAHGAPAVLVGAGLAYLLPSATHWRIAPVAALRFADFLAWQSLRGVLGVAPRALAPRMPLTPGFRTSIPHTIRKGPGQVLIANRISPPGPRPPRASAMIVLFIVFGILCALAWAPLAAPDVALAETTVGAGITGALMLKARAHIRRRPARAIAPRPCARLAPASRRWWLSSPSPVPTHSRSHRPHPASLRQRRRTPPRTRLDLGDGRAPQLSLARHAARTHRALPGHPLRVADQACARARVATRSACSGTKSSAAFPVRRCRPRSSSAPVYCGSARMPRTAPSRAGPSSPRLASSSFWNGSGCCGTRSCLGWLRSSSNPRQGSRPHEH
jgi:hypothetical protein